jgi:putative endonuclease
MIAFIQDRHGLGRAGERLVVWWLRMLGFRIVATNWRGSGGELDIVARRWQRLHIIEVKTRKRGRSPPRLAVNRQKRRRLVRTARQFLRTEKLHLKQIQFDVAEVRWPFVKMVWDAFRAEEQEQGPR